MEKYGMGIGFGMLALVNAAALLIASQAARRIRQFPKEHHERFINKEEK